jgi:fused signal recognition particle receptor
MVIGVNGVGKTTSIGKLGQYFKNEKRTVLFIAADTFRAAAAEQLTEWANRTGVRIVKQGEGADPAAVVFDGLTSAKTRGEDIAVIDTAGRLHNKANLMEELKKIDRVVARVNPGADYRKLLVIDAVTGGNALSQVEYFNDAVGIDGIILTKLDGTAKGGIVVAIKQKYNLPVWFAGVGEKEDDLIPFNAADFAAALVGIDCL